MKTRQSALSQTRRRKTNGKMAATTNKHSPIKVFGIGHGRFCLAFIHGNARATPNDPKLSDSGPGARVAARRREAQARAVPGFMAGRTARD